LDIETANINLAARKKGHERDMKKTIIQGIIGIVSLVIVSTTQTFAIEGLHISLQCSNVVLSWPSIESESYIVQYRPTLDPGTPWQTLTSSYPADVGTNLTFFIHSNIVQNPNCGGGAGSMFAGMAMDGAGGAADDEPVPTGLWAQSPNGTGPAPLFLYPPGFNTNNLIIFEAPMPGVAGGTEGFTGATTSFDAPVPLGIGGGAGGGSPMAPETGFYQVVREGVYIVGQSNLTNHALSGTVAVSFEVGNDTGIFTEAEAIGDYLPFPGANPLFAPVSAPCTMQLDTAYFENGNHTLQIEGQWLNPDFSQVDNFQFDATSPGISITVSNVISYPNWEPEIGTYSAYFAETTLTNASWQIDIYDAGSNYVQSLTGTATNGIIEGYWDLIDTNGVSRTDPDTDPSFSANITVTPSGGHTPASKKTPPKKQRPSFPSQGSWVISYQDNFSYMANSNAYYQAIYDMGGIGAQFGGAYTFFPPPSGQTNYGQTFPLRFPYTNAGAPHVDISMMLADKNALRTLLTNVNRRNFYYCGHGLPDIIAGYLGADEVSIYVKQYYRFVFLDACLTANGAWPKAFGIPYNKPLSLSYFQKAGLRPRAFLGYPTEVHYTQSGSFYDPVTGGTYDHQIPEAVTDFLYNFEFAWYYGYDVSDAISYAVYSDPYIGPNWEDGRNLQLYGYEFLGVGEYNQQGDWPN